MAQTCVDWPALDQEHEIHDASLSSAKANDNVEATMAQMVSSAALAAAFDAAYCLLIQNADVLPLEMFIDKTLPPKALTEGTLQARVLNACLGKHPHLNQRGNMGFVEVRGNGESYFDLGFDHMICVTPKSTVFVPQLGRLLSPEELCRFQGLLQEDFKALRNMSATFTRDLAGNSFATATILAASVLGISLGYLGKPSDIEAPLGIELPEAEVSELVPRAQAAQRSRRTILDTLREDAFDVTAIDHNELSTEEIDMLPDTALYIKPKYGKRILLGEKVWELRCSSLRGLLNKRVAITFDGKLYGECKFTNNVILPDREAITEHQAQLCIDQGDLDEFLEDDDRFWFKARK